MKKIISHLNKKKIRTSLFIDPNLNDINLASKLKSNCVELHTGKISNLIKKKKNYKKQLKVLKVASDYATKLGLEVHAGHGMDYRTTSVLSKIKNIKEFNIGHFIIGESVFFGLSKTIKKIKKNFS